MGFGGGYELDQDHPIFGNKLYTILIGGTEPGSPTLIRFYAWHVFGLMIISAILIGWHAFRVRRDGGIALPPRACELTPSGSRALSWCATKPWQ